MLLDKILIGPYIKLDRCFVEGRELCVDIHNIVHSIVSAYLLAIRLLRVEVPAPDNLAACSPCNVDRPLFIELINEQDCELDLDRVVAEGAGCDYMPSPFVACVVSITPKS